MTSDPKYAWCAVPRAELPKRSAGERIADFLEVYCSLDPEAAREQATRCLQCPDAPCLDGCPLRNRIPEWLALTADGQFSQAAELLHETGCMSEIVSTLCSQSCEHYCVLEKVGEPVAINAVERFLNEYAEAAHLAEAPARAPNGLRVAVLGSGPCSLACTYDLARAGFAVTVYDRYPAPGGLLVKEMPAFKLDQNLVQRRIQQLESLGVVFRTGETDGASFDLASLRAEYDAVFLGLSAEEPRPLDISGAHLNGVYPAIAFLLQRNTAPAAEGAPIEVRNKRVVILGGGQTALDCLRTVLRCEPSDAVCVYRRDQANMPCDARDVAEAKEEGAQFQFHTQALAVLGDASGQVTHLRCARTAPGAPDDSGRPAPALLPGTEFELPAEVVLVAYGFSLPPVLQRADFKEIAITPSGEVMVDACQMTNLPGVFAAGALVRRRQRVPETVRDARKAAAGIAAYLAARPGSCGK